MTQQSATADATFKADLVLLIPHLRAFAYSMARRSIADDLAQEAMLKAWKSRATYKRGTNLKAWTFTILRNLFLSDARRSWRTQPLDPVVAENTLVANDDPFPSEELLDVRNAMQLLPDDQREALILVGPAGLSYEEVSRNLRLRNWNREEPGQPRPNCARRHPQKAPLRPEGKDIRLLEPGFRRDHG